MDEGFLARIGSAFLGAELSDEYTLLEEDFYDIGGVRRHFDQLGDHPSKVFIAADFGIEIDHLKQDILDIPYWPESSKEIAIYALQHRKRAINPFKAWQEVTFEYLDVHRAVVFLSPKAFRYYLPAAITIFLKKYQNFDNCEFIDSFFFVLINVRERYNDLFTIEQLQCVLYFLKHYSREFDLVRPEMSSTVEAIKAQILALERCG